MKISRRTFVKAAGALPAALPLVARADAPGQRTRDVVVCIFQRGAADGMHLVPPYGDMHYDKLNRDELLSPAEVMDLDGFFGLHTQMGALQPAFAAGELAVVHGAGLVPQVRSHFNAQALMECGYDSVQIDNGLNGWLGRYLTEGPGINGTFFQAVGYGQGVQKSLRGGVPTGLNSIQSFGIKSENEAYVPFIEEATREVYEGGSDLLHTEAIRALDASAVLKGVDFDTFPPNVTYGDDPFAQDMLEVAQLIKACIGMDIICVDVGGWDTHDDERNRLNILMPEFANALAAFHEDIVEFRDNVTVITMTEFGRRLLVNGSAGTDHGNGSVMLAMGGGVNGGQVYSNWGGLPLAPTADDGLSVGVDWRQVLSELMVARMDLDPGLLGSVFPGFTAQTPPMGIFDVRA